MCFGRRSQQKLLLLLVLLLLWLLLFAVVDMATASKSAGRGEKSCTVTRNLGRLLCFRVGAYLWYYFDWTLPALNYCCQGRGLIAAGWYCMSSHRTRTATRKTHL